VARSKSKKPILILVLIVFLLALIGFILMVKVLPWYASVGIVIGGIALMVVLVKFLFKRFFMSLFGAKGKVLTDAIVQVNSIQLAEPPQPGMDDDDEDDEEYEKEDFSQYTWYHLDVTITPQVESGEFTYWEPGEIVMASMEAKAKDLDGDDDELAMIHDYRVYHDGTFVEDEMFKLPGPQRIRYHIGVKPGVETLRFRYYFEIFGEISFPSA
jgi:hypothetical protein